MGSKEIFGSLITNEVFQNIESFLGMQIEVYLEMKNDCFLEKKDNYRIFGVIVA